MSAATHQPHLTLSRNRPSQDAAFGSFWLLPPSPETAHSTRGFSTLCGGFSLFLGSTSPRVRVRFLMPLGGGPVAMLMSAEE